MTQYARPASDVSNSGLSPSTGSTIYGCIDETTVSDTDYVSCSGAGNTFEVKLSSVDAPSANTGHYVYIRAWGSSGIGTRISFYLYQGTTLIASLENSLQTSVFALNLIELTTAEADSITDYSDLRVRVVSVNANRTYKVSHIVMEVPDASSAQNLTLTCAAGSYSLTGTAATLTVQRNYVLSCGAGNYALTGTNADLKVQRNYTLACGSGSYTLSGKIGRAHV